MRGISEKTLYKILEETPLDCNRENNLLLKLINTCHELQEPWMTLDEFLKSGFEGLCLVSIESCVILSERTNYGFFGTGGIMFDISSITHVMPIPKPEPPK